MTAARQAAYLIRTGTPPALAVHMAARRFGRSTRAVVAGMRRPRRQASQVPANAWWNR